MVDLPVVCEFLYVFQDDITNIPPEKEVEFVIDLVPGTRHVPMAPYMITLAKLGELKSQL